MPNVHTCPKCEEETIFYETEGDDNGLPGIYNQYWFNAGIVGQDCECKFTEAEIEELEAEISNKETEWIFDGDK